ncbi:DUF2247 family protein [Pseudomonas sp. 382]|uniref:DUF2247 family protein n=1 Tax=Pseudomonas sp. 382 TaxID=1751969 RepID=UPI000C199945|nr:DUF2247 family protein [Pseudomonas sp. 382]PIK78296.1 hypothetical protein CQW31_12960 [Pseudomonas sp. 382]
MHMILDGEFCYSEAPWLSWGDINYGLGRGYLTPSGVVQYTLIGLSPESSAGQYDLASLDGDQDSDVRECVAQLAAQDVRDDKGSEKAWLFLILLWVFVNRDKYQDPLAVVEEIYADFDYPESMEPIVRYMPAVDSSLEGEDKIFKVWSTMLESSRRELEGDRSNQFLHPDDGNSDA